MRVPRSHPGRLRGGPLKGEGRKLLGGIFAPPVDGRPFCDATPAGPAFHTGMRPGSARLGRKADRLTRRRPRCIAARPARADVRPPGDRDTAAPPGVERRDSATPLSIGCRRGGHPQQFAVGDREPRAIARLDDVTNSTLHAILSSRSLSHHRPSGESAVSTTDRRARDCHVSVSRARIPLRMNLIAFGALAQSRLQPNHIAALKVSPCSEFPFSMPFAHLRGVSGVVRSGADEAGGVAPGDSSVLVGA